MLATMEGGYSSSMQPCCGLRSPPEEAWLEAGLPADTDLGSAQTHVLPHPLGCPHGLLGCSHVCLAEADPLLRGGGPAAGTQL